MMRRHNRTTPSSMDESGSSETSLKRRALSWLPTRNTQVTSRKKNRKTVNQFLHRVGKGLSLDDKGVCYFSFKKFVVCVEVPEDDSRICVLYSLVCSLEELDNRPEVEKVVHCYNAQHSSHLSSSSKELTNDLDLSSTSESTVASIDPLDHNLGIRLGMQPGGDEVNLCLSFPIKGLKYEGFADELEFFCRSAVKVNRRLDQARMIPLPLPMLSEEEARPCMLSPCGVGMRRRLWSMDSQTSTSNMSQCSLFNLFAQR